MPTLGFEGLPPYAWPGGPIAGSVVLQSDSPIRGSSLSVRLKGRELAQVTVSAGKSSQRLTQEVVFLEQLYDLRQSIAFVDPDHLPPGVYRAPFQFTLPSGAPPSLHTSPYVPEGGLGDTHRDGMYVEYLLEARLEVPLWVDLVSRGIMPVFSPRRVLGVLPAMATGGGPDHPSITLDPTLSAPLVPGTSTELRFRVLNPGLKKLRSLSATVTRVVQYSVHGHPGSTRTPAYGTQCAFDGRAAEYTGQLTVSVPNDEDATGPWQGQLYATFWTVRAVLDIELGWNVESELPLAPA